VSPLESLFCDHTQMAECCDGCGHFSCPCGITWDEGFEGPFETYDDENDPRVWS
jgi:hypothetical protein